MLVKVTQSGGVVIPAALRHRWETEWVVIEDHGEFAVIRPVPDTDDTTVAFARTPRATGR